MVCVSRFLTTFGMTAKQKGREKRIAAAKPPLYAPFSHMKHVTCAAQSASMSTEGRHLLKTLQINNFTCHVQFVVIFALLALCAHVLGTE